MLHCLYTMLMLCLLHYQEALDVHWEDITFDRDSRGVQMAEIKLHYSKTHQFGGQLSLMFICGWSDHLPRDSSIPPLPQQRQTAHVCCDCSGLLVEGAWWDGCWAPWIHVSQALWLQPGLISCQWPAHEWLILSLTLGFHWLIAIWVQLSDSFMTCFCNNLLDINVDLYLFDTHSFCCGGCQYIYLVEWWLIQHSECQRYTHE